MSLEEVKSNAVGLAEKIVEDIAKNPENADQFKALLTESFLSVYQHGANDTGQTPAQVKSILLSKTFWGAVIVMLGTYGSHLGFHLSNTDAQAIAQNLTVIAGAALTIYGRLKASKQVSLTGK